MAANRVEGANEEAPAKEDAAAPAAAAAGAAAPASGGLGAWLPLIVTIVLMPVLAYVTTTFILLPKLRSAAGASHEAPAGHAEDKGGHGESSGGHGAEDKGHGKESKGDGHGGGGSHGGGSHGGGGKGKFHDNTSLSKMLVNVAGTAGTRYLMTSVTLVGSHTDFKSTIEENKDQLKDVATSTLAVKTISDLEKPGARNLIRAELISVLNNVLGANLIQEIFITELAIQ